MTEPKPTAPRKLRTSTVVLLGALLASLAALAYRAATRSEDAANAPTIAWCEEKDGSCRDVCRQKKTTVVVFHAPWCPACKAMDEQTWSDPAVRKRLAAYGTIRVDVDANPGLSDGAGIRSIPTTIVLDGACREIGRAKGALGPDEFLGFLDGTEQANP